MNNKFKPSLNNETYKKKRVLNYGQSLKIQNEIKNVLSHNEKLNQQQNITKMENMRKITENEISKPNEMFKRSVGNDLNIQAFSNKVSNSAHMNINSFKRFTNPKKKIKKKEHSKSSDRKSSSEITIPKSVGKILI